MSQNFVPCIALVEFHGVVLSTCFETMAEGQFTRFMQHLLTYGIHRIVVAATDSDDFAGYEIECQVEGILSHYGLSSDQFSTVDCRPSFYLSYGKEYEVPIFELVKQINRVIVQPAVREEVFRMPIMQGFSVKDIGTAVVGRVAQGSLRAGSNVEIHLIQEIPYVRGMRFLLRDGRGMLADGSVL